VVQLGCPPQVAHKLQQLYVKQWPQDIHVYPRKNWAKDPLRMLRVQYLVSDPKSTSRSHRIGVELLNNGKETRMHERKFSEFLFFWDCLMLKQFSFPRASLWLAFVVRGVRYVSTLEKNKA